MMGIRHKEETANTGLHNTLAAGTLVKGDVTTETDFRLDGKVEGNIHCDGKIIIGPKSRVVGNITATHAEILGEVTGNLHIKGKLVLKSTAVIQGDILSQTLEIEPNARFNGLCQMTNEAAAQ